MAACGTVSWFVLRVIRLWAGFRERPFTSSTSLDRAGQVCRRQLCHASSNDAPRRSLLGASLLLTRSSFLHTCARRWLCDPLRRQDLVLVGAPIFVTPSIPHVAIADDCEGLGLCSAQFSLARTRSGAPSIGDSGSHAKNRRRRKRLISRGETLGLVFRGGTAHSPRTVDACGRELREAQLRPLCRSRGCATCSSCAGQA
jgi:hypothetical protein